MANSISGGSIEVKGKNLEDAMKKREALEFLNTLDASILKKLQQMGTPKGISMLNNPITWNLIKSKV